MREVLIVGTGQTPVGELWKLSLRSLAVKAIQSARQEAGWVKPQALYIGNMLASTLSGQANLGALLVDEAHLNGIEGPTFEAAGASGGVALRMGYLAIASGMLDCVVVVGVEKCWDVPDAALETQVSQMLDSDFEAMQGVTPLSQAGLLMQRYMHQYDVPHSVFSHFPVIAHANAVNNPNAMFRRAVTSETYENAEPLNAPLNLFDAAPYADGAAALVLMADECAPAFLRKQAVRIAASSVTTDTLALHDRSDPLALDAIGLSVKEVCRQAGVSLADIDLFELYDAYSIYAALTLESAGFASRGRGWEMGQDGTLASGGKLPISTMGGLKARGNPLGATGVYQAVEAVLQLRAQAGANQVKGARRALVQCLGGPGATVATHILERLS